MSKSVLVHFATEIRSLPEEIFEEIASAAISAIKTHVNNYDEADFILRQALFDVYVACEDFKSAAQSLAAVNVDSPSLLLSDSQKADLFVKCAGLRGKNLLIKRRSKQRILL